MSEREQQIIEKLARAMPNMSDFDKGYILGKAEEAGKREDHDESTERSE